MTLMVEVAPFLVEVNALMVEVTPFLVEVNALMVKVLTVLEEVTTFLVEVEFGPYDLRHAKIANRHSTHFSGTFSKKLWRRSPYL